MSTRPIEDANLPKGAEAYAKKAGARATIGEAAGLAQASARPALLVARFAVFLSVIAIVVAALSLAVVWRMNP